MAFVTVGCFSFAMIFLGNDRKFVALPTQKMNTSFIGCCLVVVVVYSGGMPIDGQRRYRQLVALFQPSKQHTWYTNSSPSVFYSNQPNSLKERDAVLFGRFKHRQHWEGGENLTESWTSIELRPHSTHRRKKKKKRFFSTLFGRWCFR